ncbi:UNVERIFIED_CONTAM: Protein TMEPAI [Gekko kuhli]
MESQENPMEVSKSLTFVEDARGKVQKAQGEECSIVARITYEALEELGSKPWRHEAREGSLWPSESTVSGNGVTEQVYTPRPTDRLAVPSFLQRDRFNRFQPTYPYMQHEIDLPPTISLSDGEEPPPYQGPCTLQLRDPEQQMELNRESVRAPPNRTIFDSDLIDNSVYGGPCPPSSNSGISATCYGSNGRMEGPPPTYSEVIGHFPGSTFYQHQQNNSGMPSILEGGRLHPSSQISSLESTTGWNKDKEKQKGHPF